MRHDALGDRCEALVGLECVDRPSPHGGTAEQHRVRGHEEVEGGDAEVGRVRHSGVHVDVAQDPAQLTFGERLSELLA
jgi:hypothetical protein